jgi:hypothetical protein
MDNIRVWIIVWKLLGDAKAINTKRIFNVKQEAGDTE